MEISQKKPHLTHILISPLMDVSVGFLMSASVVTPTEDTPVVSDKGKIRKQILEICGNNNILHFNYI
jgi:hypothetical protein